MVCVCCFSHARNVTVSVTDEAASEVLRVIVEQTGMNFVYPSDLLADVRVTVDAVDIPLKKVLAAMFRGTDIVCRIKGRDIILKRKKMRKVAPRAAVAPALEIPSAEAPHMLEEVVVVSRVEAPAVSTSEIGAKKLSGDNIRSMPAVFGESDVMRALGTQPGVSGGAEGMAEIHVHGGNADENLFMLDNVPLYHVNHLGGMFSAFNTDAIRYIDFFKSSFPAKYDGRLSSYLDVRTRSGSLSGHHGALTLGLSSGSFSISGPVGRKTTYSVAIRCPWLDLVSLPLVAIQNSSSKDDKISARYAFMDLNGKITHRFNSRATGFVSVYFGDDFLKSGSKSKVTSEHVWKEENKYRLHWGNLLVQTGLNYRLKPSLSAEFTAALTRFFSSMSHDCYHMDNTGGLVSESKAVTKTNNNISDWIFRADFDWRPDESNHIRFGAGYTLHSFLPERTSRRYAAGNTTVATRDSTWAYPANEINFYIEDDMRIGARLRVNAGFHGSLFNISGKTHVGLGPRLSAGLRLSDNFSVKASYSRTNQYVHQLCQTYLSLPTDQWVPVTGNFKPQSADKISAGMYLQTSDARFVFSAEGYWKWLHNLVDYRDEYYLHPPMEMWNARLCSGRGSAKGIDLKVEKVAGRLSGHIAYSLAWADRTFAEKNGGHTFPARFDNRHTINVLVKWNVSDRVIINAVWTGHSGNRFTLLTQMWDSPGFISGDSGESPMQAPLNNYRLPFYHRLDLSLTVRNRRGYWNFSFYNAYCHMNVVSVERSHDDDYRPVFKKIKMLPLIPSISYTWKF